MELEAQTQNHPGGSLQGYLFDNERQVKTIYYKCKDGRCLQMHAPKEAYSVPIIHQTRIHLAEI